MRDRWLKAYFFVSFIGIAFAYGVAVGVYRIFPYELLERAAAAGLDWLHNPRHNAGISPTKFMSPPRSDQDGAVVVERGSADSGVTLLTGFFGDSTALQLVDIDGDIIHRWSVPFSTIWPETPHLDNPPDDWDTMIHGALLLPGGEVIFNFQYQGLARIDHCANVLWRLAEQTHHSIHMDEYGDLWVPSRRLIDREDARFPVIPADVYEDLILQVSTDGEVLREISILESIFQSGFEGVLFANGAHGTELTVPLDRDFTHLNDVEVLSTAMAPMFPDFSAGDILVSLRNLNLLMVLDRESADVKWIQTGPFHRQHDPDFRPDGTISVFDNRRDDTDGSSLGGSRIVKVNPARPGVEVVLTSEQMGGLYTATMGDHQYLSNGNVLVTSSERGRAVELTEDGRVVWSYVNRWNEDWVALMARATRYPDSYRVIDGNTTCG